MHTWRVATVAVCLLAVACPALAQADGEDIEINIPNGGFEEWEDDRPVGFSSYNTPAGSKVKLETVFRSTDAHTDSYSALIKNMPLPVPSGIVILGMPGGKLVVPGALTSCKRNCTLNTGRRNPDLSPMTFPIDEPADSFCGYYKAKFVGGDRVLVSLGVLSGGKLVGGTDSGGSQDAYITASTSEWTRFEIPIVRNPGQESAVPNEGILQITIVPEAYRPNSMAPQTLGNLGSWIQVDTLHLCGPKVDLEIYQPIFDTDPRATGEPPPSQLVPPDREESVGAQTFVNLDNDDRDCYFDREDDGSGFFLESLGSDGVIPGDDELVKLRLLLPLNAKGKATLSRVGDGPEVRLWKSQEKKAETKLEPGEELTVPEDFDRGEKYPGGEKYLEKLVFVEAAVEPSTQQRDVTFELAYFPELSSEPPETDRVALTVIGIESIVWKGKGNGEDDEHPDTLAEDPNYPESVVEGRGLRVFPGRRVKNGVVGVNPLDEVGVEVTLSVAPVEKIPLFFKVFDVDDPSPVELLDSELEPEDNVATTLRDGSGRFKNGESTVEVVFDERVESFDFRLSLQPGDNFRIVGSGDPDFLTNIGNDDKRLVHISQGGSVRHGMRIVDEKVLEALEDPETAEILKPGEYASDVLTVWRHLYTEVDRMTPVEGNFVDGTITAVYTEPESRMTTVTINRNLAAQHPTLDGIAGVANSYAGGILRINGKGVEVTGNSANASGHDTLSFVDEPPAKLLDQPFRLVDDDARNGFAEGMEIPWPPLGRLKAAFEPAYILPRHGYLENASPEMRYRPFNNPDEWPYISQIDNSEHLGKRDLWFIYLFGVHQGRTIHDGDGEPEPLAAEAAPDGTGALVYLEPAYERESSSQGAPGKRTEDAVVQAVGSLLGAMPEDGGVMSQSGEEFSADSLKKIRSAPHPAPLPRAPNP